MFKRVSINTDPPKNRCDKIWIFRRIILMLLLFCRATYHHRGFKNHHSYTQKYCRYWSDIKLYHNRQLWNPLQLSFRSAL